MLIIEDRSQQQEEAGVQLEKEEGADKESVESSRLWGALQRFFSFAVESFALEQAA